MKRLLIATLALTAILTACSNEEELASDAQSSMEQQKEDNARLIRMWEEAAESETEETEVDNSERHQFEVGPSKAKQRAAEEENELEDNDVSCFVIFDERIMRLKDGILTTMLSLSGRRKNSLRLEKI